MSSSRGLHSTLRALSDSEVGDDTPVAPADVGWYSEASLNSRLAKRRKRPPGGRGRTRPPRSEEDYYFEAGVPGYDEDRSTEAAAKRRGIKFGYAKFNATDEAGQPSSRTSSAGEANARASPAAGPVVSQAGYTRVSVVDLPSQDRARSVEEAYETHALPAYRTSEGFLGAELLVGYGGGGIAGPGPAGAGAGIAPQVPGREGTRGVVSVTSVTHWTSKSAMRHAADSVTYKKGMEQLADAMDGAVPRAIEVRRRVFGASSGEGEGQSQGADEVHF